MTTVSWWRTSLGDDEIQSLSKSISEEHVGQGPVTSELEEKFAAALDVPYAVATTSGSVALLMALMAMGIGRDDEVIVPNRTFIATAHAVLLLGAKVVLVDVQPDLPLMDVTQVREKLTPRTKAIMPVDLNGRSVDMAAIRSIADEYGLWIVEDACQSLFSKNPDGFIGTHADVGCFSLGVTKIMTTGQGGVAVTRSSDTYEKLKLIRNHGVTDTFDATYVQAGLNFKYTDILASIGLAQLSRVPDRITHLNAVYTKYISAFEEFEFPFIDVIPVQTEKGEIPLWVEVRCPERKELMDFLSSRGIQTRPSLPDLHLSKHLQNDGDFPNSRVYSEQGIMLPCGPDQPLENIDRVIEALDEYGKLR